jgi:TIR domain-containing protein
VSYVGGRYQYDLFISYSHGTASTDPAGRRKAKTLRDWSRSLAEKLADNLSISLNVDEEEGRSFSYFLDEREFDSGEPISQSICEAAANSSILLVLASPYYLKSRYCLDEVRSFFAQAREDGRGREHCVIREIQPTREEEWPADLRDPDGRVVNRGESFFDVETSLPIDMDSFREMGTTPNLSGPRSRLTVTISKKLKDLRTQIEARTIQERVEEENRRVLEQAAQSVRPEHGMPAAEPDLERKCVYLQAETDNVDAWTRVKDALGRLVLVNPNELKGAAAAAGDDAPSLLATYETRRRNMLRYCNGLVLLRARPEDDMELQLMAARYDRATLLQAFRQNIPWALVDEVGDEGLDLRNFTIPRVPTSLPDWPERLVGALGFSAPDAA